jgi:RimJ/RimL family protein N-acetyltransferase
MSRAERYSRRADAPEQFVTDRLILRRPEDGDARAIFERYAADPLVTRYLAWPRHLSLDDTRIFLNFSHSEWRRWGCGPYLVYSADGRTLLGSSGLAFESSVLASTGYVFARDAWGCGYATEVLRAMTELAQLLGVRWLYGLCHVEHRASARVMEKCGFTPEGMLRQHIIFPNIGPLRADVLRYGVTFESRHFRWL